MNGLILPIRPNGHTWMRFVEDIGVFVSFSAKHDALAANHLLDGWECPFLADGAAVFNDFERTGAQRFGCYAHARRKFFYAIASDPRALVGVRLINDLFENERALISVGASQRLEGRKTRSAPVLEQLLTWCRETLASDDLGTRSLLAKACRYTLNQEPRLRRLLENGRVPIHNNLVELQIRHFAVGHKNWLFYGSEDGAAAGSTWLTLVLSARMHGLHVETYFRDLFRVLPSWPQNRVLELAPHAWAETRSRIDPTQLVAEYGCGLSRYSTGDHSRSTALRPGEFITLDARARSRPRVPSVRGARRGEAGTKPERWFGLGRWLGG